MKEKIYGVEFEFILDDFEGPHGRNLKIKANDKILLNRLVKTSIKECISGFKKGLEIAIMDFEIASKDILIFYKDALTDQDFKIMMKEYAEIKNKDLLREE